MVATRRYLNLLGAAALALGTAGTVPPAAAQPVAIAKDAAFAQMAAPDLTEKLPASMRDDKKLTVALALGSPPDDFRNAEGQIDGWEVDILQAAAQILGLELELRPTTFDTLIPGLQSKRFDAAMGQMGITEVRLKVVDMIGTLKGNELIAARGDSPIVVNSLDDMCGLTVATTRGARELEFAREHQPKCAALGKKPINALAFNDGNGAVESLMSKRSDLFWLGSTAVSYFVDQSKGKAKVVGSYTDMSYIGMALPKGSPLSPALQAAVQRLIDNGTYAKIVAKWGLQEGAIKAAPLNPTGTPT